MSQKKVLIIDYDAESLKSLSEFAQAEGCDVVTASDGITGLEKFKAERPDLVIMEAMLPKLHGFELCKKIAYDSAKKVPVIIVTGIYRESVYKSEAVRFYGASAFFEKPWKKEDLQPVFQSLLKGDKQPAEEPVAPEPVPVEASPPQAKAKAKVTDFKDEWGILTPEAGAGEPETDLAKEAAETEAEIDTILQSALADLGLKGGHEDKPEPGKEKVKKPKETPIFTPPHVEEPPHAAAKEHEGKHVEVKPSSVPFGGFIEEPEKKKSRAGLIIGIGAVAVVVAALFLFVLKPKKPGTGPVETAQQTQVTPSENQTPPDSSTSDAPVSPTTDQQTAAAIPDASQPQTQQQTPPQAKPQPVESKPAAKPQSTAASQSGRTSSDSQAPIIPAQTPTLQLQSQTSPPQQSQPQATPPAADTTPPVVRKAQEGDLILLDQVEVQPQTIKQVPPIYPEMARRVGVEGVVTVNALISETGDVIQTTILRGIKGGFGFDRAAETAIRQYKFRPAMKDGVRVKVWKPFNVVFRK